MIRHRYDGMARPISDEELQLKKRARRRLVGAIVLVTAVAVVLPMVLDSRAAAGQSEHRHPVFPSPGRGRASSPKRRCHRAAACSRRAASGRARSRTEDPHATAALGRLRRSRVPKARRPNAEAQTEAVERLRRTKTWCNRGAYAVAANAAGAATQAAGEAARGLHRWPRSAGVEETRVRVGR